MAHDYGDFASKPKNTDLEELSTLAKMAYEQKLAVEAAEEALAEAKRKLNDTIERAIPEIMAKCGMEEFKTEGGLKVKVKPIIRASIAKARRPLAHAWLRDNGYGGLIKSKITIGFGMGDEEKATALKEQLEANYGDVKADDTVHPATLKSWATERLEAGDTFPQDLFGVHKMDRAEVSV